MDLQRSAEFYYQHFGCIADWYDEYVTLYNHDFLLHMWKCDDRNLCLNSGLYVRVNNVDEWYAKLNIPGLIHPNASLDVKPWGMKEFAITDPDGNLIRIGENV